MLHKSGTGRYRHFNGGYSLMMNKSGRSGSVSLALIVIPVKVVYGSVLIITLWLVGSFSQLEFIGHPFLECTYAQCNAEK